MVCPTMPMDVIFGPFYNGDRMGLSWSDVSVGSSFLTWMLDVFLPWSDISAEEDDTYMEARLETNMKNGWICRTSYDKKN